MPKPQARPLVAGRRRPAGPYLVAPAAPGGGLPLRLDVLAAGDEFDLTRLRAAALGRRGASRPGGSR